MIRKLRLRYKFLIIFTFFFLTSNLTMFFSFTNLEYFIATQDADRKSNGNTLIAFATYIEILHHEQRVESQTRIGPNNPHHKIIEVNPSGNVIWEFDGLGIPHEVLELPNGHLLVADTQKDRIIEIDYPNKNIVWSWEPSLINWTKVDPKWGENHHYNRPLNSKGEIIYDWTHINDVDFKYYGSWIGCLISIKNFDLIVEVNYTADYYDPNNPNNIIWYYGDFWHYDLMNGQHNPDYLRNGNIIVSDSGNDRIIEVNYTTKEIVWVYDEGLLWPRDADELEDGNLLITDSCGGRVIEINRQTKEIVWSYDRNLLIPYESDMLDNGNILISNEFHGQILEVNRNGIIVWWYGFSYINGFAYLNSLFIMFLSCVVLYYRNKIIKNSTRSSRKIFILFRVFLILSIIFIYLHGLIISVSLREFYRIFGSFVF